MADSIYKIANEAVDGFKPLIAIIPLMTEVVKEATAKLDVFKIAAEPPRKSVAPATYDVESAPLKTLPPEPARTETYGVQPQAPPDIPAIAPEAPRPANGIPLATPPPATFRVADDSSAGHGARIPLASSGETEKAKADIYKLAEPLKEPVREFKDDLISISEEMSTAFAQIKGAAESQARQAAKPAGSTAAGRLSAGGIGDLALGPLQGISSAIGGITSALSNIASSSAPLAFQTLAGSARILSLSLGQVLQPALVQVSFALQRAGAVISTLDDDTKKTITTAATWAVGIGTTALAVSKLTGVMTTFGSQLASLGLLNPFAALAAGALAVAASSGKLGSLVEIGEQLTSTVMPALEAIGQAALGLATSLSGPLATAIQFVAGTVQAVAGVLNGVGEAFGIGSNGAAAFAVTALLLNGRLLSLAASIEMSGVAAVITNRLTTALAATFGLTTAAARTLSAALVATGIGGIVIAAVAATSAILSMSGAFGQVGDMVEAATKKIRDLEATLDKLGHGGRLKEGDLKQALNPDEYRKFVDAKNTDERKKVLEDAKKRVDAEVESGKTPENSRRIQAHLEDALSQPIDLNGPGNGIPGHAFRKRSQQIRETIMGAGATEEQADQLTEKIRKAFPRTWSDEGPLAGKDGRSGGALDPEAIKGIMELIKSEMESAADKAKLIEEALKNGVGQTRLGALQALQTKFPHAFHKEMSAQQIQFGDVRAAFQNQINNKDPLEARILEEMRKEAAEHLQAVLQQMKRIDKTLGGPGA